MSSPFHIMSSQDWSTWGNQANQATESHDRTTWDDMITDVQCWFGRLSTSKRSINPQQPFADEFPGRLSWTNDDEGVSSVVDCQNGPVPYLRGSELGSGGFARVYKVMRLTDGTLLAGKSCKIVSKLRDEARVLSHLNHDHILRYEGFYEDTLNPEATMLFTEICAGEDLERRINSSAHGMPGGEILRVIKQMASALEYLHGQSIFHSDLKPGNILIRSLSPINVVLGDCADIKKMPHRGKLMGTAKFYAPEILQHKRHMGPPDDVWALGVSVLGMMGHWPRFILVNNGFRLERDIAEYPHQCWEHAGELAELNSGHEIVNLAKKMLAWKAEERPRAGDLVEMAEMALVKWEWEHGEGSGELGIIAPAGFAPIEFW